MELLENLSDDVSCRETVSLRGDPEPDLRVV